MIRLLNLCHYANRADRRRRWMDVGHPLLIGTHQVLTLLAHTLDGEPECFLRLDVPGDFMEAQVPMDCYLDVSRWSRLLIIPRAVEFDASGRVLRVFVEFVRTSSSLDWAV